MKLIYAALLGFSIAGCSEIMPPQGVSSNEGRAFEAVLNVPEQGPTRFQSQSMVRCESFARRAMEDYPGSTALRTCREVNPVDGTEITAVAPPSMAEMPTLNTEETDQGATSDNVAEERLIYMLDGTVIRMPAK